MVYVCPNTMSTFVGDEKLAIENGFIGIDEKQYEQLLDGKLVWEKGKLVEDTNCDEKKAEEKRVNTVNEEIKQLKKLLETTDYIAIKHSEGWITDEDYAETKALRQEWRDRINTLEREGEKV